METILKMRMQGDLININEVLKQYEYAEALSIIAMLLEELCKRTDADMIKTTKLLLSLAKDIRQ